MGMRITNKIIQNNALSNINTNKLLEDKLEKQMASGKKISRPSDDPVIAIRALRLRSTLSEVTQYCDKNVEDADSWLTITEDSINTLTAVLEDMIEQCNEASNEYLESQNKEAILENLKALRDEIYASGDADYAGRGVFTGYRTGTKLRFQEDTELTYEITESLDKSALDDITYVKLHNENTHRTSIDQVNAGNYLQSTLMETDIFQETVHRLRLSYDGMDDDVAPVLSYYDTDGNLQEITADVVSKYDEDKDAYQYARTGSQSGVVFIPETGELILSDAIYQTLSSTQDEASTSDVDESQITVTYRKSNWEEGDLRPEHYFACIANPDDADARIEHNIDEDVNDQIISYDVGFNQSIRVNTLAGECFTHDIGRDVDDLISVLEQVKDLEDVISDLEGLTEDTTLRSEFMVIAERNLAVANKAYTYLKEKMQTTFEGTITRMQNHLNTATLAMTNVGTRSSKVELVKTRLSSQKTNFKDLVADNEQVDTAEVATELASAKLAYDGALMATSKILGTSLLDYI